MRVRSGALVLFLTFTSCADGENTTDVINSDLSIDVATDGGRDSTGYEIGETGRDDGGADFVADTVNTDAGGQLVNTCLNCHTNTDRLVADLESDPYVSKQLIHEGYGECCGGDVEPLPIEVKVRVTKDFLEDDIHGNTNCVSCHKGDPTKETRKEAHVGVIAYPSREDPEGTCGNCHFGIVETHSKGFHATERGKRHVISQRAGLATGAEMSPELDLAFTAHCNACHASCGDCHISSPAVAGGGFVAGHAFKKNPSPTLTCMGCHGTRIKDEMTGKLILVDGDVHWDDPLNRKVCTDCHGMDEMHGVGHDDALTMHDVPNRPRCSDCHEADGDFNANPGHSAHTGEGANTNLSCQACHSNDYKNCQDCHVRRDENDKPVYEVNVANTGAASQDFKLGRNVLKSDDRPEDYVVVRHAPANRALFDGYGENLLPEFNVLPTWHVAAPHNIQKNPHRGKVNCTDWCHNNRERFLSADDMPADEVEANKDVIVDTVPAGPVN